MMRYLAAVLLVLSIVACGQTGPLRHPEPQQQEESAPEGEDEHDDAEDEERRDP